MKSSKLDSMYFFILNHCIDWSFFHESFADLFNLMNSGIYVSTISPFLTIVILGESILK
jgi:hypothetical protein